MNDIPNGNQLIFWLKVKEVYKLLKLYDTTVNIANDNVSHLILLILSRVRTNHPAITIAQVRGQRTTRKRFVVQLDSLPLIRIITSVSAAPERYSPMRSINILIRSFP